MLSVTVERRQDGATTVCTVRCGRMVAHRNELNGQAGSWTVIIGRNLIPRVTAADIRTCRGILRRSAYARALYRVEIGKA